MATTVVQVSIPDTGAYALRLYPTAGGAIANGAAGDTVARDGDNPSLGTHLRISEDGLIVLPTLPTSDPAVSGALWSDAGTLKISA